MRQLELQFDGFAPVGQALDASAAKQRMVQADVAAGSVAARDSHGGNALSPRRESIVPTVGILSELRARFERALQGSEFCQVLGITPWLFSLQGLAFTAFVGLVIIMVCGLAEWLEGGAL